AAASPIASARCKAAPPGSRRRAEATPMRARAAYRCARRALTSVALASLVLATSIGLTRAEHPRIARLRAAEQKTFTDEQIIDGFFKIAFGAGLAVRGRAAPTRNTDGPGRGVL